jgi:hypothetical protein
MSLPVIPPRTATLDIDGVEVTIRSLSRAEAHKMTTFGTDTKAQEDGELHLIACAFDCTAEEAKAWRAATPFAAADKIIDEIIILSGIKSREQIAEMNARARGEEPPKAPDPQ